jgi:hypothetical protein
MESVSTLYLQGRRLTEDDIQFIRGLLSRHPDWSRTHLSKELCQHWNWRRETGALKDIACRSLLRRLEQLGHIRLPKGRHQNSSPARRQIEQPVLHSKEAIKSTLKELYPIELQLVESGREGFELNLFKYLISTYHYLGWSGTVGENLKYLFYDNQKRVLGCLMFGAAAWKVKARDDFIGWSRVERESNLSLVVNNNRFLILPWVEVPHLASHILGKVCRRLLRDWREKYNHPVYLLETFVEKDRFQGTCYKASNWIYVGETKGRGKLDVKKQYLLPIKDIWLYPLETSFRENLCTVNSKQYTVNSTQYAIGNGGSGGGR